MNLGFKIDLLHFLNIMSKFISDIWVNTQTCFKRNQFMNFKLLVTIIMNWMILLVGKELLVFNLKVLGKRKKFTLILSQIIYLFLTLI